MLSFWVARIYHFRGEVTENILFKRLLKLPKSRVKCILARLWDETAPKEVFRSLGWVEIKNARGTVLDYLYHPKRKRAREEPEKKCLLNLEFCCYEGDKVYFGCFYLIDERMPSLEKISLSEESPAEIVLTTFYPDGRPHASTMSARADGNSKVLLRIFTSTNSFQNISRTKAAVINIVRDVELLAGLALKDLLNFGESRLSFKSSKCVNAPRLVGADAWVEIEVEEIRKYQISDELGPSEVAYLTAGVRDIEVGNPTTHPFKRSESFVIESAILATRILEALKRGREKTAKEMLNKLAEYQKKCELIAPNSKDSRIVAVMIDSFKNVR